MAIMNDHKFMLLDEQLYNLIDGCMESDFTMNEDQKTFNKYCKLRNKLVKFIDKTNKKLKESEYDNE